MSKGEDKVKSILDKSKISYVREKTFPDFRNGKLRFDFYLPDFGILIEVDGQQHFERVKQFHPTQRDFTHAKQNDYYKNSYALSHGIKLFRIPYWEIENVNSFSDIISAQFLVTTKWHNDLIYRKYLGGRLK